MVGEFVNEFETLSELEASNVKDRRDADVDIEIVFVDEGVRLNVGDGDKVLDEVELRVDDVLMDSDFVAERVMVMLLVCAVLHDDDTLSELGAVSVALRVELWDRVSEMLFE